jgi:hypothetical protein
MAEETKNEEIEEKDDIDKFLDDIGADEDTDEEDKKDDKDTGDANDGEDDQPVTLGKLKELLKDLAVNKTNAGKEVGTDAISKLREELKKDFEKMVEPVLRTVKTSEYKKSLEDFEQKVKADLPAFEVDMDLLEYHLTIGKTKKEALKLQVEKERARAEKYGYKKEPEDSKGYDNKGELEDLSNFDPELHKDKTFRKLSVQEKDSYWKRFSSYMRKNKG